MDTVVVEELSKRFRAKQKLPGVANSLRTLLSPRFSEVTAVNRLSFCISRGEVVGFIGPNGAGKSTTLKMLTGILFPSDGAARVMSLTPWRERRRLAFQVASVFGQRSQLWYHLPPADSFGLLARVYELDGAAYRARLARLVELFALQPYLHVPVRKLSLGERMRCEIAAALLHCPRVIFLDEPTIGLDVVAKQQIRALVRTLAEEEAATVLLTSHDAGDIEQVCRRVMVINHGALIFDDTLERLRRSFLRHKVIDVRLAEAANAVEIPGATVVAAEPYRVQLEVDTERQPIEQVVAALLAAHRVSDITVEEPPLDEVIAAIYAAGTPAAGERAGDAPPIVPAPSSAGAGGKRLAEARQGREQATPRETAADLAGDSE